MSRAKGNQYKTITVGLDPELAYALDRAMIDFGLDSKGDTVRMIIKAWLSMTPLDTTVYEVCQQSVKEIRKGEFDALANFYEERARLARSGAGP